MSLYNEEDNDYASEMEAAENSQTINKIANFLEMKNIFVSQFWQSNRNYASPQDLQKFCQVNGLKLGVHDQINLKNELFVKKEVISIYEFCDKIPQWKCKGSEMISTFLKQRSEVLVQNLNNKYKNQRAKSSSNIYGRPVSGNSVSEVKKNRLFSAAKESVKTYKPNNSKKYLEQNRLKNLKKQQQLAETIEKTKNEHQYNMLMKMNQLNQYNHKNKSTITYRAYKNAEGIIQVRTFQLETLKKQLTIQEFESEYKIFKKSTKQNKDERPMSVKFTHAQDLMSKTLQSTFSKNQKKQQRQQQLRNLLNNTVNLTKLLQEQIKIFKMKGIYGCENI